MRWTLIVPNCSGTQKSDPGGSNWLVKEPSNVAHLFWPFGKCLSHSESLYISAGLTESIFFSFKIQIHHYRNLIYWWLVRVTLVIVLAFPPKILEGGGDLEMMLNESPGGISTT